MADEIKTHEFDCEVFAVGTWNGDKYTDKDLDEICKNFETLKDVVKCPIKLGHNEKQMADIMKDGQPALGWVKALRKSGNKLVATLTQVPEMVYRAIKAGLYKRVSSEIYMKYRDKAGNTLGKVYAGVALLGADIPAVDNLKDLTAFLTQHMQDQASFERVAVYSWVSDADGTISATTSKNEKGDSHMADNDVQIYKDKIAELEALISTMKPDADLAKTFKAELDLIKKQQADDRKEGQKKDLKAFCEKAVADGKMPPAVRDKLCDFDKLNYSEDQGFSVPVTNLIDALGLYTKILATDEKAHQKSDEKKGEFSSPGDELHEKALKYARENKVSYTDATIAVLASDTDLAEKYVARSGE